MAKVTSIVEVGLIQKTFGLNGELTVKLFDTFPADKNFRGPLFIMIDGLAVPFFIGTIDRRGVSRAVIVFDDIDSEVRASEFTGCRLFIYSDAAIDDDDSDDDQLYYEDMIGFTIIDTATGFRGEVVEFLDYPQNPVFSVDFGDQIADIPANNELIIKISTRRREVKMRLPEGIFEI